eukprot:1362647-Prymnesium_polylepis.1
MASEAWESLALAKQLRCLCESIETLMTNMPGEKPPRQEKDVGRLFRIKRQKKRAISAWKAGALAREQRAALTKHVGVTQRWKRTRTAFRRLKRRLLDRHMWEMSIRYAGHTLHREAAGAWSRWLEMVETRAASLLTVRHGVALVIHQKLSRGWRDWRASVAWSAHAASQFTAAQRAARRLQHQQLARALSTWVAMVEARQHS